MAAHNGTPPVWTLDINCIRKSYNTRLVTHFDNFNDPLIIIIFIYTVLIYIRTRNILLKFIQIKKKTLIFVKTYFY